MREKQLCLPHFSFTNRVTISLDLPGKATSEPELVSIGVLGQGPRPSFCAVSFVSSAEFDAILHQRLFRQRAKRIAPGFSNFLPFLADQAS